MDKRKRKEQMGIPSRKKNKTGGKKTRSCDRCGGSGTYGERVVHGEKIPKKCTVCGGSGNKP